MAASARFDTRHTSKKLKANMRRLEGRIAIVTGTASGLGLSTSKRFAAEGATVVIVDRREEDVRRVARESGQALDPVRADITSHKD
jgi:NAD(P)-dependent dehydrogenase (short-subunit alcohol dehydrogenase family)